MIAKSVRQLRMELPHTFFALFCLLSAVLSKFVERYCVLSKVISIRLYVTFAKKLEIFGISTDLQGIMRLATQFDKKQTEVSGIVKTE